MDIYFYSKQGETKKTLKKPCRWEPNTNPNLEGFAFRTILCLRPRGYEKYEDSYGNQQLPKKGVEHEYCGPLYIDIDVSPKKGIHNVQGSWKVTKEILDTLKAKYGLEAKNLEIYFSGSKGYHIIIPQITFGMMSDQFVLGLPYMYKRLMHQLGFLTKCDGAVYSSGWGRQFRLPNVPRVMDWDDELEKPIYGPCKVQLSYEQFMKGVDFHTEYSMVPRPLNPAQGEANEALTEVFNSLVKKMSARTGVSLVKS